jgi:hypothetical protein
MKWVVSRSTEGLRQPSRVRATCTGSAATAATACCGADIPIGELAGTAMVATGAITLKINANATGRMRRGFLEARVVFI